MLEYSMPLDTPQSYYSIITPCDEFLLGGVDGKGMELTKGVAGSEEGLVTIFGHLIDLEGGRRRRRERRRRERGD